VSARYLRVCGDLELVGRENGDPVPQRLPDRHTRSELLRTVDVYVLRLRQKIEQEGGPAFIRSVRGFGYSFNVEVPQEQLQ